MDVKGPYSVSLQQWSQKMGLAIGDVKPLPTGLQYTRNLGHVKSGQGKYLERSDRITLIDHN